MKSFLIFCLLILMPISAMAESKIFPPSDPDGKCAGSGGYLAWNGNGDVFCASAKDILKNALPGCSAGQVVMFNGNDFYCASAQAVLSTAIPSCGNEQVVIYKNGQFICANQATFGGMYSVSGNAGAGCDLFGSYHACSTTNPMTGGCSCPAGTKAYMMHGYLPDHNWGTCFQYFLCM